MSRRTKWKNISGRRLNGIEKKIGKKEGERMREREEINSVYGRVVRTSYEYCFGRNVWKWKRDFSVFAVPASSSMQQPDERFSSFPEISHVPWTDGSTPCSLLAHRAAILLTFNCLSRFLFHSFNTRRVSFRRNYTVWKRNSMETRGKASRTTAVSTILWKI